MTVISGIADGERLPAEQGPGGSAFLRNCWQVAAFATELSAPILARRLLGVRVVLFRCADGSIVALEDCCPHRLVPLSIGRRIDDAIQCGYHGTIVGADGTCLRVPGQDHVPPNSSTLTYPVVERYGMVWIWMGAADLADLALVPDVRWLSDPEWSTGTGYKFMEADYRLITDNLLDLSHETYIHSSSIGNRESESIADFPATVRVESGQRVFVRRDMISIEPPPMWSKTMQLGKSIDRLQIASYMPPGINITEAGVRDGGSSDEYRLIARLIHFLTPESGTSTHYFFTFSRNFAREDEAAGEARLRGSLAAFDEDTFVLELQQRTLLERGDSRVPNMSIALDAGPIQGRRILAAALDIEAADPRTVIKPLVLADELARPQWIGNLRARVST